MAVVGADDALMVHNGTQPSQVEEKKPRDIEMVVELVGSFESCHCYWKWKHHLSLDLGHSGGLLVSSAISSAIEESKNSPWGATLSDPQKYGI